MVTRVLSRALSRHLSTSTTSAAAMTSDARKTLVAVCQMTSTGDRDANLNVCRQLVAKAAYRRAKLVFLPEALDVVGRGKEETLTQASTETGVFITALRDCARQHGVWISVGGFHEQVADSSTHTRIVHLVLNDRGDTVGRYEKLHLFDVDIPGRVRVNEHDWAIPGNRLVLPVATPAGRLGLSVCYDLRFPELSGYLRANGAEILSYPAAFTVPTGMAHWEVMLRARAIETQCYVVAAAQAGAHNDKRASYGHAMIVDPWGHVLARCAGDHSPDVAVAEIDLDRLDAVRQSVPCFRHKRSDLYRLDTTPLPSPKESEDAKQLPPRTSFDFGGHVIPREHVFLETALSFAFVNRKPVLPGHVLVCPLRPTAVKLSDVTPAEASDLLQAAARVERVIEKQHGTDSSTVSIQNGLASGRSVHVRLVG